jgi:Helix-turn-helix domain
MKNTFHNKRVTHAAPVFLTMSATTHNNSPSMPLLTDKQAAPLLGVAPATLRSWRCHGIGPAYVKLGLGPKAACRYIRHDIEAFIEQCRQVPCVRAAWETHGDL